MATARKRKEKKAKNVALVAAHITNLKQSNFSLDIYGRDKNESGYCYTHRHLRI
jgi:hypothetical protein